MSSDGLHAERVESQKRPGELHRKDQKRGTRVEEGAISQDNEVSAEQRERCRDPVDRGRGMTQGDIEGKQGKGWQEDTSEEGLLLCQGEDPPTGPSTPSLLSSRGEGDVKSLLQFVNIATSDIKAALDKSAPCKRSVDHRKYLQKQLRRYTGGPSLNLHVSPSHSAQPSTPAGSSYSHPSILTRAADTEAGVAPEEDTSSSSSTTSESPPGSPLASAGVSPSSSSAYEHMPSFRQTGGYNNVENYHIPGHELWTRPTQDYQKSVDYRTMSAAAATTPVKPPVSPTESGALNPDDNPPEQVLLLTDGLAGQDKDKAVPLRQRQLPASFWQEPNHPRLSKVDLMQFHPVTLKPYEYKGVLSTSILPHYPIVGLSGEGRVNGAEFFLPQGFVHKYPPPDPLSINKYPSELSTGYPFTWHHYGAGLSQGVEDKPRIVPSQASIPPHSTLIPNRQVHTMLYRPPVIGGSTVHPPAGWDLQATGLAHRPHVWRPIPTKTMSTLPARYHPFADVH